MKNIQKRNNIFTSLTIAFFFSIMIFEGCITSFKNNKGVEIKTTLSSSEEYLYQLFKTGIDSVLINYSVEGVIVNSDSVGFEIARDSSGLKSGASIVFCSNGNIIRGSYANNKKSGLWIFYDKNLNVFQTVEYLSGKETRQWNYVDGKVVGAIIYSPKW